MDNELARLIGERIRFEREANHQTQVVVAGLSGITPDYLYQIERGKKLPTLQVLLAIAKALGKPAGALLNEQESRSLPPVRPVEAARNIHRALTLPLPETRRFDTSAELRSEVHAAWDSWQHSHQRYSKVSGALPQLITNAELLLRDDEDQDMATLAAIELYSLVRTVSKRLGRTDSALLAADRAKQAASKLGRPLPRAASAWNMAHVLLAENDAEGSETVAIQALSKLQADDAGATLDGLALQGALLSVAAVAGARLGQGWTARDRLRDADKLAKVTGERNTAWTAFGPTSVAIGAVSVENETGEVAEALRLAERIVPPASLSIERRVAFLLEQARGYELRRDYGSALVTLQTAGDEAPEDVSYRPAAQRVLSTIVHRGRSTVAQQGVAFATKFGIAV
ncbi:helix-turn-helix domain-containing protein [Kutzneria chonburiensis]|uniref:Helix-turn-helix domain-containing protein n=1 Tax=Kutzneria chonburiensis TaxID=1483604 RepID=A0ABV6N314_9PSEU|nr:helix-turn-helix transcriptional regulator [Kutzneria chonburiensis]